MSALSVALAATLVASTLARLLAVGFVSTAAVLLLLLSSQPQLRAEASGFGSWLLSLSTRRDESYTSTAHEDTRHRVR